MQCLVINRVEDICPPSVRLSVITIESRRNRKSATREEDQQERHSSSSFSSSDFIESNTHLILVNNKQQSAATTKTAKATMTYISSDGTVGGGKTFMRTIFDFFGGIWSLLALFFTTITNPKALETHRASSNTRTFAQRNNGRSYREPPKKNGSSGAGRAVGRGANIRGLNGLGDANCAVGGGG